jgi:hypothetical protein
MYQSGKATIYIIPCTINLKPSSKAEHEKLKKKQSEKELEHLFRLAKMAAARAVSAMALFFLVTLCASQMVSSLRPGVGLGTCRASGYLPGRSGNCEKSNNDPDCCEDGKMYPQYRCSPPVTASTKAV